MNKNLNELKPEEILDNLHMYLNRTGHVLKEKQMKLADEKMTLVLNDGLIQELLEKYKNDGNRLENNLDYKAAYEEIELVLLKFYYAIYNDNLELYRKFLNDKVDLGNSIYNNKIYLLNRELTDMFKNYDDYINYVKVFQPSIKRFYSSIGNIDSEERDNYIKSFQSIIKSDKRYLYRKKTDSPPIYMNLLTARNLRVYGEDFLKKATYKQKEVINSFYYNISDELLEKIKFLIKKYPNYVIVCKLEEKFIENFTIDEIAKMTPNQTIIYNLAAVEEILPQVTEVFKLKPDFTCPDAMIKKSIFEEIPADTIILLSENAKSEICKVKRDYNFRKNINRIINKDLHNLKDRIKKRFLKKSNNSKKR